MTFPAISHKTIRLSLVWSITIVFVCLQFVGITASDPESKRVFVIVGWIPYVYVFLIAIQGLRSKGIGDQIVFARCVLAFILGLFMYIMLTQTDLLSITTAELWNRYLAIHVFVTLLVTAAATS